MNYSGAIHAMPSPSLCGDPLSLAPLPSPGDTWTETLAYVLFWGTASVMTFAVILFNGRDFVDAPKLVQKEKMD